MNEAIQKLIDSAGVRVFDGKTGIPFAAVPEKYRIESLEHLLCAPERIRQTVSLTSLTDFVEYVNKYKKEDSIIFVTPSLTNLGRGQILAKSIIDYHSSDSAHWGDHEAILKATPSPEYELLMQLDGQVINQSDFALKLRDISRFCVSHAAADILEVVRTLTLTSTGNFESIEDDFSGSVKFGYDVQVKANAGTQQKKLEVPRSITFKAPLLLGAESVEIEAELLYRIPKSAQEKVHLGLRLPNRKWQELAAVSSTAKSLKELTGLLTVMGNIAE